MMTKKLSLDCVSQVVSSYSRIWNDENGEPSSHQIIQDINKTITSTKEIYKLNGTVVHGLGNRKGHRFEKKGGHGGSRRKKKHFERNCNYVHPDAIEPRMDLLGLIQHTDIYPNDDNDVCIDDNNSDCDLDNELIMEEVI